MKLKKGVKLAGVKPETILAMNVVDSVYKDYNDELTVTCITDSHKSGLHPKGWAFDCRIWAFSGKRLDALCKSIVKALTDEFDVVLEPTRDQPHIHIEFDPKNT